MNENLSTRIRTSTDEMKARARTYRRSRSDRMLGGVCGGAAELLGVDAAILRIALVATTLLGFGVGAIVYFACWLIVPEEDDPATP